MEYYQGELGEWVCSCCGEQHELMEEFHSFRWGPITPEQDRRNQLVRSIWEPAIIEQLNSLSILGRWKRQENDL